jgi:predicted CXXCH cytochrome family protein
MYDGLAHVRIGLEYEMSNIVTIKYGNDILFNEDVFYAHSWESGIVPEEYKIKPFHTAKNEWPCLDCHRLKPRASDMIPDILAESICFPCHSGKFEGIEFEHVPAGVNWECLQCHRAEAKDTYSDSPVKFSIEQGARVAPLCFKCHKNKEKEVSGYKFLHGPVAMSRCNMCHNPHGSNYEKFLQSDITSVCINCHEMQKLLEQPVVHTLVLQKGCTACHDPHGSNYPKSLFDEVKDVCLKCHPKTEEQKNNHPVTGHPVTGPKDPHNDQKKFSCVSCHNPHAAEFDKLLPVPELMMFCINCHS